MKRINVSTLKYPNLFALVDDEDFEQINRKKWFVQKNHCGIPYVLSRGIKLHRAIMGLKKGDKKIVDHINRNPLDNRKKNLRLCSNQQNCMNSKPRKGTSQYKGVSLTPNGEKWYAQMTHNGKHLRFGSHDTEEGAARAYDTAAKKLHGEYARFNLPDSELRK